jgi:AMP phosphorylase
MKVECTITDGSEPLMRTIGPLLEAKTVLETLEGKGEAALAEKACTFSGLILSMVKGVTREEGFKIAKHQLESGRALEKFRQIITLQGGNPKIRPGDLKPAKYSLVVKAKETAKVSHVDNKIASRVCRALGAPQDAAAGLILHSIKGEVAKQGEPLYTLYSSSKDKLKLALEPAKQLVEFEKVLIEVV